MARLFISYSRRDEPFVRRLATSLAHSGANLWLDVESIPAGSNWSSSIQEGLDITELMLLVISQESMASENVANEWQYFIDQKKPIIPLLLKPTKIHFQINRLEYVDFHSQSYDAALQKLYAELGRKGITLNAANTPPVTAAKPTAAPKPASAPTAAKPSSANTIAAKSSSKRRLLPAVIVLIVLLVLGGAAAYALQPRPTPAPLTVTIGHPAVNSVIGNETLCIDGTADAPATTVTVTVMGTNSSIINLVTASVDENRRWKAILNVLAQSPSDGVISASSYGNDPAYEVAEQSIAIKLTDHYLPLQPSLGIVPDDLCQDSETTQLSP